MYLKYNYETGEVTAAYNIQVQKPYIEITEEEYDKIKNSEDKYFVVNDKLTTTPTTNYTSKQRITEIDKEVEQAKVDYETNLETSVKYTNGNYYKPIWVDDGTYSKLITAASAGILTFPQTIWDATEKEENAVSMTQEEFMTLVGFLALKQQEFFNTKKETIATLLDEKEELENSLT